MLKPVKEKLCYPQVGMVATIRHRRGIITSIEEFGGDELQHLVTIEYIDSDGAPEDTVVWEREPMRDLLEAHALPNVSGTSPMIPDEFDALIRGARWSAITPYLKPDNPNEPSDLPIASPFFGAIQVDDFQLIPLLKALRMQRISLLLADDVGLGKTIEAGLILSEMLLRRRIRKILIACPASLRSHWQSKMKQIFSLDFDVIDSTETHALRQRLGLDANPWRTYSRIITSYHYLKQRDILQQFLATCAPTEANAQVSANLPWDLLIVDEAHNLMPSSTGNDSDLTQMLRNISPWFEHKLFLTATPHNGHTSSFTGLLELLDPVRFTRVREMREEMKNRVQELVIRRLKSEINALDDRMKRPRRFASRYLNAHQLFFTKEELALSKTVNALVTAVKKRLFTSAGDKQAGMFAIEVLNKRLLSCPYAFAESWYRLQQGFLTEEQTTAQDVTAAQKSSKEDTDDDRELQSRISHASNIIGSWLRPFAPGIQNEIEAVNQSLDNLGLIIANDKLSPPKRDTRLDQLCKLINQLLRQDNEWKSDDRLIVFTEYKTTLDYLHEALKHKYQDNGTRIQTLYGGMPKKEWEATREQFNDAKASVRVLIATDVGSEGLDLQYQSHSLLHYDIPWNPSRLEQRNGRIDRHGQAHDVVVHHFTSENDADVRFIGYVVGKINQIREDLGSMGEVFDTAFERRFIELEEDEAVTRGLEEDITRLRGSAAIPEAERTIEATVECEQLEDFKEHIDLSPETLLHTLEVALGWSYGHPRLEPLSAPKGVYRLKMPIPPHWEPIVDETLRIETKGTSHGALPKLIFDPKGFFETIGRRSIFRPKPDTRLMHLSHPMLKNALGLLARCRFPGSDGFGAVTRWIARSGDVPEPYQSLVLVTIEELALNELREPFHHWIRTLRFGVMPDFSLLPLSYSSPVKDRMDAASKRIEQEKIRSHSSATTQLSVEASETELNLVDTILNVQKQPTPDVIMNAKSLWDEIESELQKEVPNHANSITKTVTSLLHQTMKTMEKKEKTVFTDRIEEVKALMDANQIKKLNQERDLLLAQMKQKVIFEYLRIEQETKLNQINEELASLRENHQVLLKELEKEQERILKKILPRRFTLRGKVEAYPVAIEILLPEKRS